MIWITQYYCHNKHPVIGAAWDDKIDTREKAEKELVEQYAHIINDGTGHPCCRICSSNQFHFVSKMTPFNNMQEAMGPLKVHEASLIMKNFIEKNLPRILDTILNQSPSTKLH